MQIHELTLKKKTQQVDEGIGDFVKGAGQKVGQGVGLAKKFGTAVASPFRDVAAGYRSGKVDAKTGAIADKAYRSWSAYRQELDKNAPGGKADPATLEKQLMAFVSKNLLGGQYLPNLINKDQIIKLVKQIAGNDAAPPPPPPADTNKPGADANANAPQDAAATVPAKIEAGKEVTLGKEHYRWLGAQWALVNPKTGQPGKTAEKGIAPELTKMAQAGKFVTPYTSPDAGALSTDQMAANAAAGKKASPTGFDTATGKPLPKPTTTGAGARLGPAPSTPGGAGTTAPATPADEPIIIGGKKLDPKFPGDAKTIANLKASGQLNEYADLYKKLQEAVYKAKANNPNAADQTPYVQGRTGDGANPGQFAKFDPATSTAANAGAGIGAMAAGGQAARAAGKPAPVNPANELELFKKLVAQAAQAQTEVATGAAAGAGSPDVGGAAIGGKKVQDPRQMMGAVAQAVGPTVDTGKLKAAGDAIRKNFQIDASIGSTDDDAVDALLMNMGFQPT
jgi:hypothetical protein